MVAMHNPTPSFGTDLSRGGSEFPRAFEVRQKLYGSACQGLSTRLRRLERYEAFYKCVEYDHCDTGWDGLPADRYEAISPEVILPYGYTQPAANQNVPLRSRRPSAPQRLCPMVVDRFTGLLFSKDRTPKVQVEGDADAEDFLQAVWKKTRFWRTMHQARTFGGWGGSTLVTLQLRKARWSYTAHNPKTVQDVVWEDPDLKIPAGVLIQYMFAKEIEKLDQKTGRPTGKYDTQAYVYRRIIDEEWDIIFKPAQMKGTELPVLEPDMHLSYRHELGRFPGAYIQNLPSDDELDGLPDCQGAYQMFHTIDLQVSQSNKGLLANQDPTVVIGRDKKLEQLGVPLRKGSENALIVGQGGSAQYMEMTGGGIAAARDFVKDQKQAAMDKCQAVLVDPEKISGAAQSAKAIEYIYSPMLEKAGRLREQYGEAIELLADLTLTMARTWADPLKYKGRVKGVMFDLPPKVVEIDDDSDNPDPSVEQEIQLVPRHPGSSGIVSLEWGPYFQETPQDIQLQVAVIASAYTAGLIDQETAIRKIARLLKIEDVDGLLRRVREEAEQKRQTRGSFGMPSGLFPGEEDMTGMETDVPGPGSLPPVA